MSQFAAIWLLLILFVPPIQNERSNMIPAPNIQHARIIMKMQILFYRFITDCKVTLRAKFMRPPCNICALVIQTFTDWLIICNHNIIELKA